MIEYKTIFTEKMQSKWMRLSAFYPWETFDYSRCKVRIADVIYNEYTEEFEEALLKEQLWEKLTGEVKWD